MMNKKGMSLVEVIVALALLVLSIGSILGVLIQNMNTGRTIDYSYVATNLAKNRIERLREVRRDRGYADLANWGETDVAIDRDGVPDNEGDFQRTTIVDAAYGTNLTQVTVQVKYAPRGVFVTAQTELITLLSPYYE